MPTTDKSWIYDVLYDLAQAALAQGRVQLCEDIAAVVLRHDEQKAHQPALNGLLDHLDHAFGRRDELCG